jgi:CDP-diacylglycerol--glycerol-3-phosphate 3-phosphatidyltransferase
MNLPNAITLFRIALVPVFVTLAYGDTNASAIAAFSVFLLASLTDSLDGYLARKNDQISRMGQFLDPLADKLLVGAALYVLVDTRDLPIWVALVIAVREIAVQILRTQIVSGGGNLPASPAAKAKTFAQIAMVCWWLLPWAEANLGHWILAGIAVLTTLWSGIEYFTVAQKKPEEVGG